MSRYWRDLEIAFRYTPIAFLSNLNIATQRNNWFRKVRKRIIKSKREHRIVLIAIGKRNK